MIESCHFIKHNFKIHSVQDNWLTGYIYYKCEYCAGMMYVDRLYFYLALQGRAVNFGP